MHFEEVFDIGIDYGASGGLGWQTQIIQLPNGRSRRNQSFANPLGRWQIGDRNVSAQQWAYISGFHHAMRGRLHSFLYKDWNDYIATAEQLVNTGAELELIKAYGLEINGWVRRILKPRASGFVLERDAGAGWAVVDPSDYELDTEDGTVTLDTEPATSDLFRWSGEFYVPARFDRDVLEAQFLGLEVRPDGPAFAYSIGALDVVEEVEA